MNRLKTSMPTVAELQADAEVLMRKCMADWGQTIDEAVVKRQAAKCVKAILPGVRSAWRGHLAGTGA